MEFELDRKVENYKSNQENEKQSLKYVHYSVNTAWIKSHKPLYLNNGLQVIVAFPLLLEIQLI